MAKEYKTTPMSGPGSAMVRAGGLQLGILVRRCSARAGQGHCPHRGRGTLGRGEHRADSWWSCQLVMVEAVSGSLVSNSQGHGRGRGEWPPPSPRTLLSSSLRSESPLTNVVTI